MFGDIGSRTAILAAQCQALQDAQGNQDDRSCNPDSGVIRQDADDEGRCAHDQDRHQEGEFTTDHVAQAAKHQRAERSHDEARGKCQQCKNEAGIRICAGEELLGDDCCQRAVQVEVVPFEYGAQGRGKNDFALLWCNTPCSRFKPTRGRL